MADRVGIVGVYQTKYEPRKIFDSYPELVFEVSSKILEETGLSIADMDQMITNSQDSWDGRTISNRTVSEACGSVLRSEAKVAMDGSYAVFYAALRILSGCFDSCLLVSHCKMSEGVPHLIHNTVFDPLYQRLLGFDELSTCALQAKRYLHKYGITEEQCAQVAVKNLKNGQRNPYAHRAMDVTVGQVMSSRMLANPIKELDAYPITDGACAMILAAEDKAKKWTPNPVWITGMASRLDSFYLGDRDLAEVASLNLAAQKAYSMAGITNPRKEIDLVELSDYFSYQELLWLEGMGFCQQGEGGKMIDQGITAMGGELPVNPSGGILSGNPITVAGAVRVAEAALQLMGKAKERQVEGAKRALAQGHSGPCGQGQCVVILERGA
ncbi:MAG: thiolase family protein [Thermodesulfobacteriota bacterium]|nr:thiolase family protein [Thermodesulfobacteriota bacterium]